MPTEHPLRDLARRIEDLARGHIAHTQAVEIIRNCSDHLHAIALIHELHNQDLERKNAKHLVQDGRQAREVFGSAA